MKFLPLWSWNIWVLKKRKPILCIHCLFNYYGFAQRNISLLSESFSSMNYQNQLSWTLYIHIKINITSIKSYLVGLFFCRGCCLAKCVSILAWIQTQMEFNFCTSVMFSLSGFFHTSTICWIAEEGWPSLFLSTISKHSRIFSVFFL